VAQCYASGSTVPPAPADAGKRRQPLAGTLLAIASAAVTINAAAADVSREAAASITPDRPGLGDGAWVVAPGVWQLETGLTLVDAGSDRQGEGSALLRLGLPAYELRITLPSPLWSVDPGGTEFADLGLGFKVPLGASDEWVWALVANATVPTGTDGASDDEVTAALTLVGEHPLGERTGFTINLGGAAPLDSASDGNLSLIPTLSFQLAETLSAYAGYGGYFDDDDKQHWLEAGFTLVPEGNLQWDLNSAYEVESADWFLGVGFSWRWN